MENGIHGSSQSPSVHIENLTDVNLIMLSMFILMIWVSVWWHLWHKRVSQEQSSDDQARRKMPSGEHHEAEKKHRRVEQQRLLPSDGVTHEAGEYCGHKMTQDPATRYEKDIIMIISLKQYCQLSRIVKFDQIPIPNIFRFWKCVEYWSPYIFGFWKMSAYATKLYHSDVNK